MLPLYPRGQVVVCLACTLLLVTAEASAADVVVVKSREFSLYDQAVNGFIEVYKGSISTVVMTKKGPLGDPAQLADAVRGENPKVILAVGLRAAKSLKAEISDVPIVFCMAMHPLQYKLKGDNTTGVELEPWPHEQLEAFKRAVPGLKRLGVIYDPKRTGRFVDKAIKAAPGVGMQVVARKVNERREVMDALGEIIKTADALWILRDATVLTREFFNHTLIVQVDQKLPLIAYSPQFVKKGALCSFATDYPSQGRRAAELVNKILSGASPADIPITAPQGTLTINLDTAAKIGVKVPKSVLEAPDVKVVK